MLSTFNNTRFLWVLYHIVSIYIYVCYTNGKLVWGIVRIDTIHLRCETGNDPCGFTCSMLGKRGVGGPRWGWMLAFLELARMVDATELLGSAFRLQRNSRCQAGKEIKRSAEGSGKTRSRSILAHTNATQHKSHGYFPWESCLWIIRGFTEIWALPEVPSKLKTSTLLE